MSKSLAPPSRSVKDVVQAEAPSNRKKLFDFFSGGAWSPEETSYVFGEILREKVGGLRRSSNSLHRAGVLERGDGDDSSFCLGGGEK